MAAAIAYENLKPEVKAKVNALLHKHPQYDLLAEKCPKGMDADLYVFMRASTWPDMLRSASNPLGKAEHHATWHYINFPINIGETTGPEPKTSWKAGTDPENILQALAKCDADLKDDNATEADKAKQLSWLEHLVGDLHQPLHAVSLFSPQFPAGDKGGTSFWVTRDGKQANLHSLWDQALGNSDDVAAAAAQAKKLAATPALTRKALAEKLSNVSSDAALAKDSAELAKTVCYQDGKLQGATGDKHNRATGQSPALPAGYRATMEELAKERVALAGYRLADRVNQTFAPASPH